MAAEFIAAVSLLSQPFALKACQINHIVFSGLVLVGVGVGVGGGWGAGGMKLFNR